MALIPIVFGSATVAGLLGLLAGVIWREPVVAGVGAVLSALFCLYFAASPYAWEVLGWTALGGNALAVVATSRGRRGWALGLLVPYAVLLVCAGHLIWVSGRAPGVGAVRPSIHLAERVA
jgi:hypothetical protein